MVDVVDFVDDQVHQVHSFATIARHFDGAVIDGHVVDLGVAGLHIACSVNSIRESGAVRSAISTARA